ncbi:hypothetical protein CapIbe_010533 [Capra ibex]
MSPNHTAVTQQASWSSEHRDQDRLHCPSASQEDVHGEKRQKITTIESGLHALPLSCYLQLHEHSWEDTM